MPQFALGIGYDDRMPPQEIGRGEGRRHETDNLTMR